MFGHGRTPGTHDFGLIKEGFHVAESSIPQLVFVNNPHKLFGEGSSFQDVLGQHEKYIQGARQVLDACILHAENSLERRLFHRMRERLTSLLFVSAVHRSGVVGNPPEIEFSEPLRSSLEALVTQRLKPANDLIVSALMEIKIYLLSSRRNSKIQFPTFPPTFFKETNVELVVTLVDPDQLKSQVDELFQNGRGKNRKELMSFLSSKCASRPVIEELLRSVSEYHLEETSFRMFLVCHLSGYENKNRELDDEKISELKEQLYDDFKSALESVDLLRQEGVFDDSNPPGQAKIGRPRKESIDQDKARDRDRHFAIRHAQLVSTPLSFKLGQLFNCDHACRRLSGRKWSKPLRISPRIFSQNSVNSSPSSQFLIFILLMDSPLPFFF